MKRLFNIIIVFLLKPLIIMSLLGFIASCAEERTNPKDDQNTMAKEQYSIDTLINSTQPTISLPVNQWVLVNQPNEAKWRLGIGRNDKEVSEVIRSEKGVAQKIRFLQPGEYAITIESIVTKSALAAGQAPNIQKYQLNLKIQ